MWNWIKSLFKRTAKVPLEFNWLKIGIDKHGDIHTGVIPLKKIYKTDTPDKIKGLCSKHYDLLELDESAMTRQEFTDKMASALGMDRVAKVSSTYITDKYVRNPANLGGDILGMIQSRELERAAAFYKDLREHRGN